MKIFNKTLTVLCTFILILSSMAVFADSSDPVVSLSYLTQVFAPALKTEILNEVGSLEEKEPVVPEKEPSVEPVPAPIYGLAVVPEGKSFIGAQGCEFILRSGKGISIVAPNGGLCDVTAGRDIGENEDVPANHLIIIPRDDMRGFLATEEVIVMVKGEYSIK